MKKSIIIFLTMIFVITTFTGCSVKANYKEGNSSQHKLPFDVVDEYDTNADGVIQTDEENPNTDYYLSQTKDVITTDYTENGQAKNDLFEMLGDCYTEYKFDDNDQFIESAIFTVYSNAITGKNVVFENIVDKCYLIYSKK